MTTTTEPDPFAVPGVLRVDTSNWAPGPNDPAHRLVGAPPAPDPAPAPVPEPGPVDDDVMDAARQVAAEQRAADHAADQAADKAADAAVALGRPDLIVLKSGRRVILKPLRGRELLAVVDIAIGGLGGKLPELDLDPDQSDRVFLARFAGLLISAIPGNPDAMFGFFKMVCEPERLVKIGRIDKAVKARNDALRADLDAELDNPDPDDIITIIEGLARNNAADLQSWGKRLAGIFQMAKSTGRIPASPTSTA